MVLHATVVEDIGANLGTPFDLLLAGFNRSLLLALVLKFDVVDLRLEEFECHLAVLGLVARHGASLEEFLLFAGIGVGVHIAGTYTRLHLIDVLTACATRTEGVPSEFARVDLDLDGVVDEGEGKD